MSTICVVGEAVETKNWDHFYIVKRHYLCISVSPSHLSIYLPRQGNVIQYIFPIFISFLFSYLLICV